jgi:hypothetical protein
LGSEGTIKTGPYLEVHDDRALPIVSFLTVDREVWATGSVWEGPFGHETFS